VVTEYVGVDLHRRRSVIVRMDPAGVVLSEVRIPNDPAVFASEVEKAGPGGRVVLEATYGWYWAVDLLQGIGVEVHLAHPLGLNWGNRRRKDDHLDARDLADLLRLGRLPESWIAPPATRELRELVRYRSKVVSQRTSCKAQVHSVLAKHGVPVVMNDLFGVGGNQLLDRLDLGDSYRLRVDSLRRFITAIDCEVDLFDRHLHRSLAGHPGYEAIREIPGVGQILAAVFVAEIGDVTRFARPEQVSSWAGLTPRHRESDTTVVKGRITKQGSRLVRWAAVEAAMRARGDHLYAADFHRIAERRGRKVARVAVARRILTLVFYGLRDHHIRRREQQVA
jgi:transposase